MFGQGGAYKPQILDSTLILIGPLCADSRGDVHTVPETQGPDNNSPESVSISTPGEADTSPSTGAPELPTEIAPENVPKLKDLNKNSPVEQKLAYYRKTVKEMMAAGQVRLSLSCAEFNKIPP